MNFLNKDISARKRLQKKQWDEFNQAIIDAEKREESYNRQLSQISVDNTFSKFAENILKFREKHE